MSTTVYVTLESVPCYLCGVTFGLEANYQAELVRSHRGFYCPNGHEQFYTSKTEAERLRDELAREKHRLEQAQATVTDYRGRIIARDRTIVAVRGHFTRIKKRIAAGVCPCCKRSFQNVAQHMKGQHPTYAK